MACCQRFLLPLPPDRIVPDGNEDRVRLDRIYAGEPHRKAGDCLTQGLACIGKDDRLPPAGPGLARDNAAMSTGPIKAQYITGHHHTEAGHRPAHHDRVCGQ